MIFHKIAIFMFLSCCVSIFEHILNKSLNSYCIKGFPGIFMCLDRDLLCVPQCKGGHRNNFLDL